jgi:endo-1,4-beta-mannosidase
VDDAKRDTPHHDVQVWHYTEVNHVKLAMDGRKAVVNEVLPKTHVDFVSYSSYDTASDPQLLKQALSFIESKLPAKPGFSGKRVFIGEFGFPAVKYSPAEQELKSRHVLQAALEWGCPFALYWEMYNNEMNRGGHAGQLGFWMIDDKGAKQPIYETYRRFYQQAHAYVADFTQSHGRPPTSEEYSKAAVAFLK